VDSANQDSGTSPWKGRLQIALAATLWSSSGFFAKAPWFEAWPEDVRGLLLEFWRSFFACLCLVPMIRRPEFRWQIIPMVVCFAVMVWSFMTAMVYGTAANAIWLQYLSPAWVMLAGIFILKEPYSAGDGRMFVFCMAGVLLMLTMEMTAGQSQYATVLGIISGLSFAGVVICLRTLRGVDPAWLITLNHGATALLLAPWIWRTTSGVAWQSYVALGFFGVFQMSIPYIIFARGLSRTPSPEASILTLIEPILVPLWVYIAWRNLPGYEAPQWWTRAGGALILFGLMSRYLPLLFVGRRVAKAAESD